MKTLKAGCYLIDAKNKKVALVYRERQNDYSFPKGHLDQGETIEECAIRETAEETKRVAKILQQYAPTIEEYKTPKGEECKCYMFFALDVGKSSNASLDTHPTHWVEIEKVEDVLTYESLRVMWRQIKPTIIKICNSCAEKEI